MKITRIVKEEICLPEGVNLEGLPIQNKLYDLVVKNNQERLELQFYKIGEGKLNGASPEFAIRIHEKGMFFERYLHRPNHDHDDVEKLQLVTNSKKAIGLKKGEIFWNSRGPYPSEGADYFYIPFGAITSDD